MDMPYFRSNQPHSAAQRESADTGLRNYAAGDRQAEDVCFAVEIAQRGAALNANGGVCRIHMDRPHAGKIDDQAIVAKGAAAHVVTPAADGRQLTVFASEIDSVHDVGHARAAGDEPGPFIDAGIPDLAGVVVAGVLRFEQLATEYGLE